MRRKEKENTQNYFNDVLKLCNWANEDMKVDRKIKYLLNGLSHKQH